MLLTSSRYWILLTVQAYATWLDQVYRLSSKHHTIQTAIIAPKKVARIHMLKQHTFKYLHHSSYMDHGELITVWRTQKNYV